MNWLKRLLCHLFGQCQTTELRDIRREIEFRLDRLERLMGIPEARDWKPRDPFGL